ncbi:hypothetical protein ZWY2020_026704 [Hordeum vulgare]|nr:hypothetical protein ZWY2020_026704 [Hordeum vulgare]
MGIETTAALPDDVLLEVLARVADVAALFRCAAVCKLWRSLIADGSFLHRRWPDNASHRTSFVGFFTQQRLQGKQDEDLLVGVDKVTDPDSPPVFVPVRDSALGPGFLGPGAPAGLLNGATPLAARGGLLLVRLAPHDDHGPVNLAVCAPFAGTCDMLPPLVCEPVRFLRYAILTSQDCYLTNGQSTNGRRTAPPVTPHYSTFFRVLAMGLASDNGYLECNLHRCSSTEPRWAVSTERLGGDHGHGVWTYGQNDAAVCSGGMAHWLCDGWSAIDDSSSYFTIDVRSEDADVSLAKLSLPLPAIKPTLEHFHMADHHGDLSLFCLHTGEEGLGLEVWTRRKGADWYLARVVELRPRIEGVTYLWHGEKSDTLFINSDAEDMYVAYLDTGAVEKITNEFHGLTTDDAIPMEIDWPSLFMSRLGGR